MILLRLRGHHEREILCDLRFRGVHVSDGGFRPRAQSRACVGKLESHRSHGVDEESGPSRELCDAVVVGTPVAADRVDRQRCDAAYRSQGEFADSIGDVDEHLVVRPGRLGLDADRVAVETHFACHEVPLL